MEMDPKRFQFLMSDAPIFDVGRAGIFVDDPCAMLTPFWHPFVDLGFMFEHVWSLWVPFWRTAVSFWY
jgi:hypothetical protein